MIHDLVDDNFSRINPITTDTCPTMMATWDVLQN